MFRFLCLLAVAAPLLFAPSTRAADADEMRDLLVLVGLDATLATIAPAIIGAVGADLPPEDGAATLRMIERLVGRHFDETAMMDDVVRAARDAITDADLATLDAFYRGEVGRRATELEIAAGQSELDPAVLAEGQEILQRLWQADDPRVDLYRRMVTSLRVVETATALVMNTSYAMIAGMMGSSRLPYSLSDEEILGIVNAQSAQIRDEILKSTYAGMAYTYRDMGEAELEAYVAFLETDPARDFYAVVSRALQGALLPRVKAFGHELMRLTGARKA